MKLVRKQEHYKLFQDMTNLKLYVTMPSDQNHVLDVHEKHEKYVPLNAFIEIGTKCAIITMLEAFKFRINIDLIVDNELILGSSSSSVSEHVTVYYGSIKLESEKDGTTDLVPLTIKMDKDGNFFSIQSKAIKSQTYKVYHPVDKLAVTQVLMNSEVRIIAHTFTPDHRVYYAAQCLTAVVSFGKRLFNFN